MITYNLLHIFTLLPYPSSFTPRALHTKPYSKISLVLSDVHFLGSIIFVIRSICVPEELSSRAWSC